jgi:alpha-tubulin suppressor-like RCC1 family protein
MKSAHIIHKLLCLTLILITDSVVANDVWLVTAGSGGGGTGSGTQSDPYVVTNATQFDSIINNTNDVPINTTVNLGPGTFYTAQGIILRQGLNIIGSGMDVTVISLDANTGLTSYAAVIGATSGNDTQGNRCNIAVSDFTVDLETAATSGKVMTAVFITGNNARISRVKVNNWGSSARNVEQFLITIGNKVSNGLITNAIIEDCVLGPMSTNVQFNGGALSFCTILGDASNGTNLTDGWVYGAQITDCFAANITTAPSPSGMPAYVGLFAVGDGVQNGLVARNTAINIHGVSESYPGGCCSYQEGGTSATLGLMYLDNNYVSVTQGIRLNGGCEVHQQYAVINNYISYTSGGFGLNFSVCDTNHLDGLVIESNTIVPATPYATGNPIILTDVSGAQIINNVLDGNGQMEVEAPVQNVGIVAFTGNYTPQNNLIPGPNTTNVMAPAIVTQPTNQIVLRGNNATFTVMASGTAPLAYQWWLDGTTVLVGATNASLTLTNVQTTNSGNYSVVVTSLAGSVTSFNAGLMVNFSSMTGAIAAGRKHTLALKSDGTLLAGGSGGNGQIGDGTTHLHTNLVSVLGVSNVVGMAAGQLFSYAWESDGTAWALAWGDNRSGQLGNGTTLHQQTNAIQISNLLSVVGMAGGGRHGLAVESDGTVWGWGDNGDGQLGDGTWNNQRLTPIQVTNLTSAIAVAAGHTFSLALESNGTVWAWGCDNSGQLGYGKKGRQTIPVMVTGLTNVTAIAAGNYQGLALSNGMVWTWGGNYYGGYRLGPWSMNTTPVPVANLSSVVAIAEGSYHGLALKFDGTVWAWGYNAHGQLGNCTTNDSIQPVQVSGLSNVVAIAAGGEHSVALKSDGTIAIWGYIDYGREVNFSSCPIIPEPAVRLVPTPPFIVAQPTNQTLCVGAIATFSVTAGDTSLNYQWYFNGTNLLVGATNATLTLTNVQLSQVGSYTVLLTNLLGSLLSSNATLTMLYGPVITQQPANNTASPNGSVTLSVSASGGDLSYAWQFNGTSIAGATGPTLTIPDVTSTNVGVYTVIVSNPAGSVTSPATIVGTTGIEMFAGVIVYGPPGSNYLIQATANLASNHWTTLTNVALPTQPYIYIDYSSPTNLQEFYRAVPQ